MSKEKVPKKRTLKKLDLNKETVVELNDSQSERAEGGQVFHPRSKPCPLAHELLHEANDAKH